MKPTRGNVTKTMLDAETLWCVLYEAFLCFAFCVFVFLFYFTIGLVGLKPGSAWTGF